MSRHHAGDRGDHATNEPVFLIVGCGSRAYREYLLASIADGRALWLLDRHAPDWAEPYLAGSTVLDVHDEVALQAAARDVAAHRPVAGLICYGEMLIAAAAGAAASLGLAGMTADAARTCRDKNLTRRILTGAGIAQPRSLAAASLGEARAAADRIGYPVVVKPRGLGSSWGVIRVDRAEDMEWTFAAASGVDDAIANYQRGVLVEEMLDGPEISVDGLVSGGEYRIMYVAHKELGPAPFFAEIGHVLIADDPLLTDASLPALLEDAHRALGIDHAITHSEVRFTPRGPRIVEVNGRLGGDLIPYLGWMTSGIDPGEAAVGVAAGAGADAILRAAGPSGRRDERRGRPACAGIRFAHPAADCRVTEVRVPAPDDTIGLLESVVVCAPGTEIRLPPNGWQFRCAFVICEADGADACRARLDAAEYRVEIASQPLSPLPAANAR